jgi:small subunit ribosomal protein S2
MNQKHLGFSATRISPTGGENKSKNQQTNRFIVKKITNTKRNSMSGSKYLKVKLGATFTLKINALGPKNSGLVELPNGLTVVVPNTHLGDLVKVKLEKVLPNIFPSNSNEAVTSTSLITGTGTKKIMILGSLVQVTAEGNKNSSFKSLPNNIEVGKVISVTIQKKGPKNSGLTSPTNDFTIIVPNASSLVAQTVQVQITKIKSNYAFASLLRSFPVGEPNVSTIENNVNGSTRNAGMQSVPNFMNSHVSPSGFSNNSVKKTLSNIFIASTKLYHIVLPLNTVNFGNFFALKLNGNLLFVKKSLGIELGDHILIKLLRIRKNFSIAKVEKILQKTMIGLSVTAPPLASVYGFPVVHLHSVHPVGEAQGSSVSATASLSKVWRQNSLENQKQTLKIQKVAKTKKEQERKVKTILKKMVDSSMHYGERAIKCNANMRSYIWLRKKGKNKNRPLLKRGRHVINLFKTYKSFKKVLLFLSKYAANGQTFLFVGTKKSASSLIARTAVLSQTSFFVNSRWLGGMLTNWKTIFQSISQIKPILKEKQKVIQNLLISRQRIKDALLSKVNILRKKSRKLMFKGKKLILQLQQNPNSFIEKNQFILNQKILMLIQNQNYIEKYSTLSMKEQQILLLMNSLKSNYNSLLEQKKFLSNQILNAKKELSELKQLFLLAQELATFKNSILASGKEVWSISYEKFNQVFLPNPSLEGNADKYIVPTPSVQILNQIIAIYYKKLNFNHALNQSKSTTSEKPIVLSKLVDKFLIYLPFMKKYLLLSYNRLANKEKNLRQLNQNIAEINEKFQTLYSKALTYKKALEIFKSKLVAQQKFFKVLKIKLQMMSSEQRLFKFLPKLRYLPATKTQMYQRVELLMKKFVDPKISYVIDQIYDQKFKSTSKKMAATRKQKWQRLEKYFGGVTQMAKISSKQISNNVAIIIGQQEEMNAVRECQKLGIKMFTVVDTNCNPKLSDHMIPANDDSSTSIEYILGQMLTYIRLAQKLKRKISFAK